ncbi:hypothetical protein [Mesorhizobium amorphae]|uniref:hypothetical protein n=1 Tax=Mesorhizobium amorphae TaxID=71433 RepID=UPI0011824E91|nr:hypothetical protein [Mesorhizobium amorphae]
MLKKIPEEKAKQGRRGTHVLWILIVSLLLAVIAWGAVEIYGRKSADGEVRPPITQGEPSSN